MSNIFDWSKDLDKMFEEQRKRNNMLSPKMMASYTIQDR